MFFRLPALAGLLFIAGCQSDDPFGCNEAFENGNYEQAVTVCADAYAQTADSEYGAVVAQSYYQLDDAEQLQLWAERLSGTAVEAGLWSNVGRLLRSQGEYQQADTAFQRDYDLYELDSDHEGMAAALYWRGYIAWETAAYKEALQHASGAFDSAQTADSTRYEVNSLYLLFSIFQDLGYYDSAEQILGLIKERISEDDASGRIYYLVNESVLRMSQQRMLMARNSLQESLSLLTGNESRRTLRAIYINLIETSLSLGDIDSAAEQIEKAWDYMEPGGRVQTPLLLNQALILSAQGEYTESLDVLESALIREDITPYWRWQVHYEIGRIAQATENAELLVRAFEDAIAILDGFRDTLSLDELKAAYLDKQRQPYEALFKYYALSGDSQHALDIVEKAKARTFLDAYIHSAGASRQATTINSMIEEAPKRFDMLRELLPAMNASPVTKPKDTRTLLEQIRGHNVLMYFETDDDLWLLSVNGDGITTRLLHSDIDSLRKLVFRFVSDPNDHQAAADLGGVLLPAELLPESGENLYIVPDSILGKLPFSALLINNRRVVQDYIVSLVPSISSLLEIEQNAGSGRYTAPVIIGDPLNDLPAARLEAVNLGQYLNSTPYIGTDATREVFFSSGDSSLLHLATHSGISTNGPWVNLADGRVTASSIMANRISPRLVILASCSSAVTDNSDLWGSLGTAFLASGTDAVLASLWTVDDQVTKEFIEKFYSYGASVNPADALAKVQREFIQYGKAVSDWSGFVLLGVI